MFQENFNPTAGATTVIEAKTAPPPELELPPAVADFMKKMKAQDPSLYDHSLTVAGLALAVAGRLDLPQELANMYGAAALLHDSGKVADPQIKRLVRQPRKLTPQETEIVRRHPQIGAGRASDLLRQSGGLPPASIEAILAAIRSHHERWDGSGYPRGLHGEQIPLGARIIAVADSFAAMTDPNRTYRQPIPPADAAAEIQMLSGVLYDPAVVRAFSELNIAL